MLLVARFSTRRPVGCLLIVAAVTVALAAQWLRLELRTDGAALHPIGDAAVEQTARDRRVFGDPEELILLLTPRPGGPPLVSAEGLRHLARLHQSVAALPGIQTSGVRSAASLIDVASSGIASLGRFLDEVPGGAGELAELLERLRERPWTDGLFLASDGSAAAIYAPLDPARNRRETVAELERWAAARAGGPVELRLAGPAIAEALLGERILADLCRLVPVMVAVVAVLLFVCLRTPGGVLAALSKLLVVLVWTGGLMAAAGLPVTLVTTVLPVLLMALSVTDEVHVLARFQATLRGAGSGSGDSPPAAGAILATLRELYRPVVYTSFSTALGFLSFLSASIVPMRHFGVLAAVGLLLAMLTTFTLTPALIVLLPRSWFLRRGSGVRGTRTAPQGHPGRRRSGYRPIAALAAGLVLLAAGIPGVLRLSVEDSWIDNFDPESSLVRAERHFNTAFWGTYRYDVVLTGRPGFFHRPEGAALAASAARVAAAAPHAGGVVTYLEPLDTVAELLGLPAGAAALPADALTAVLEVAAAFEEDVGLGRLKTPDGRAARLLVFVNSPDYGRANAVARHLDHALGALAERAGVSNHAAGDLPLAVATVRAIVHNQLRSIAWTLAGIAAFLLLVDRKPWLTLVQLVPAVAAAWLVLSAMGYAGMSLGVATSMFTALTIGVGVDLALHVTYAFEDRRARGLAGPLAVRAAFERTAEGRRWSTAVLSVGFLVLVASAFGPNHALGVLLSGAMLTSYLTTGLFVPGMLAPLNRRAPEKGDG